MMLRDGNSRLRSIAVNDASYNVGDKFPAVNHNTHIIQTQGKWVTDSGRPGAQLQFQVFAEVARDNWLV